MTRRGLGAVLLAAAAVIAVVMLGYLAGLLIHPENDRVAISFWLSAGLTVLLSVTGGFLLST